MSSNEASIVEKPENQVSSFKGEVIQNLINTFIALIMWPTLLTFYNYLMSFGILGFVIALIAIFFLTSFTASVISQWFSSIAYKKIESSYSKPYLNTMSKTGKCPFLARRMTTFSCKSEPIIPFEEHGLPNFEKCHNEELWKVCWNDRINSITSEFESLTEKQKQEYLTVFIKMGELASPAEEKILEIIQDEDETPELRVLAGYVAGEIKSMTALPYLIEILGTFENRTDIILRSGLVKYNEVALPMLEEEMMNIEHDTKIGVLAEIVGRIGKESSINSLNIILQKEEVGDFAKLKAIYALQDIARSLQSSEAIKVLFDALGTMTEEEDSTIFKVFSTEKLLSFPLIIPALENDDLPQEKYDTILNYLETFDEAQMLQIFAKIEEEIGKEQCITMAKALKNNAFDQFGQLYYKYLEDKPADASETET